MNGPTQPHHTIDEYALTHPSAEDALLSAGVLIHWVTSDRGLLERLTRWAEHCPGDLDPELVCKVLAATHGVLTPGCDEAVTMPGPGPGPARNRLGDGEEAGQ